MTDNEVTPLPKGPYKAYDLLTNESLGGYLTANHAYLAHPDRPIEVIYRPSKKRVVKEFPHNG